MTIRPSYVNVRYLSSTKKKKLSNLSGLKALVDFPTRGNSVLDNCLTNNEALFSRCYPIVAQMKTDHKGVILPAGVRLKPLRFSCIMRDY